MPSAPQMYQAAICPRSSLPAKPSAVGRYNVFSAWRTTAWVRYGAPAKSYRYGVSLDGSLDRNAYGLVVPALSWVKNVSSRARTAASPPIALNSPRGSYGTIQVYCAPLPSTYMLGLAGLNGAVNEPSRLRGCRYPFPGLYRFSQYCARAMNFCASAVSPRRAASCAMPKSALVYSSVVLGSPGRYPSVW